MNLEQFMNQRAINKGIQSLMRQKAEQTHTVESERRVEHQAPLRYTLEEKKKIKKV